MFNYKEYIEKQVASARRHFQSHFAKLERLGGDDGIEVLDWRDKTGDFIYSVRYVFDHKGNTLTITGDLGEAVVCPSWVASLEGFVRIGINPEYFLEKVRCSSDRWDYNRNHAEEDIRSRLQECLDTIIPTDTIYGSLTDDINDIMESFSSFDGWANIDSLAISALEKYDHDWREWLFSCGKRIHPRVIHWLVGIQMAWEQITQGN